MHTHSGPPTVWPDSPRVRESDPITSHAAADGTTGSVAASQSAVIRVLTDAPRPLADSEIEQALHGLFSPSRVRTARHELEEDGRVVCDGLVKPDGRRYHARAWKVAS